MFLKIANSNVNKLWWRISSSFNDASFCCLYPPETGVVLSSKDAEDQIFYLLHEKDENLSENLDEVNEEVQWVGNEVPVSVPGLPDDQLCVEHDEATEDS